MRADVIVIGAGPAGLTAASHLARDHDVLMIEEHGDAGLPVQCAGLITPRGIPSWAEKSVLNRVRGARIHSPLGFTLTIEAKDTRACVVDRFLFDRALYERALDDGVRAQLNTRATGLRQHSESIEVGAVCCGERDVHEAPVVIGCDGYKSMVRRAAGARPARHMLVGMQVDLKGLDHDEDFVDLYLGSKVAPGFFAWAIPAGEVVRVGLCVRAGESPPSSFLSALLSRPEFSGGTRVSASSGKIPIGPRRSAVYGRLVLAGDAACHAKPLSGGGVFTGIRGAELAAASVHSALESGKAAELRGYDQMWKEAFGRELAKAFRIRRVFLTLSDKKMDKALRIFDDPALLSLIQREGDIDYPASLAQRVLKLAPKLAHFSPQLIESLLK